MIYGSLPIGTKVYKEDRTLVNIESLKIGDKLLSLKLDDEDVNSPNTFYSKYVIGENKINKNKLSFAPAEVLSINILKNFQDAVFYSQYMYINNPIVVDFFKDDCFAYHINSIHGALNDVQVTNNLHINNFKEFNIRSYKKYFIDTILKNEEYSDDYESFIFGRSPYVSISLSKNYFYFTENLCLVGIVPEIVKDGL